MKIGARRPDASADVSADPAAEPPIRPARGHGDWILPLCILGFCVLVVFLTTTFERVPPALVQGIQPADFPILLAVLILGLTLLLVWQTWRSPGEIRSRVPSVLYLSVALIALFVALAAWVDLFIGLVVFFLGLSWSWGERRAAPLLICALVLPVGVFFLFDLVLEIRFPRGLLTELYYD